MPTITNTTKRPLAVPLPQGKKLHLGPGRSGEVTPKALEHPPLHELIEAGTLHVDDGGRRGPGPGGPGGPGGGGPRGPGGGPHSQTTRNVPRRTGDG